MMMKWYKISVLAVSVLIALTACNVSENITESRDNMQLETVQSIDTSSSTKQVYLVETHTEENWQLIKELPYQEDVGTITQYKNFDRGIFGLSSQESYILDVSWHEDSPMNFYCIGQNGYQEEILLSGDKPIEIKVPEDGLYHIRAPLNGESITELYFSLSVSE